MSLPPPDRTPLVVLVDNVYFFPITWRKLIIDFCRIQRSSQNRTLALGIDVIEPRQILLPLDGSNTNPANIYQASIDELIPLLDTISSFPMACSLLSYFARAERTYHIDDFLNLRAAQIDKEMHAATDSRIIDQVLIYSGLMGMDQRAMHSEFESISLRLQHLFTSKLRQLSSAYGTERKHLYFPAYSKQKNLAYNTQINFLQAVYGKDTGDRSVTSLQLLRLYAREGVRISGWMEMRIVWFFNDLKPRVYYTNGGDSFFCSLYIQQIANEIVKLLPSTNPATRFSVSRIGPVTGDQVLITYDYSSFTSSLAELKYFLFWLANQFDGTFLSVYDPFQGVRELDMGQYIREYNTYANQYMEFSVERFDRKSDTFFMGLSGALGIKGNIVFSTALHGIALADITKTPDNDCCVGDDALTSIFRDFLPLFVDRVNALGHINIDKFNVILPTSLDPLRKSSFKFLKRPLDLDGNDFPSLGSLDAFPDIASILYPEGDGIHTVHPGVDRQSMVVTFIMQLCRFSLVTSRRLAENAIEESIYGSDIEDCTLLFQRVYETLGLPTDGHAPGYIMPCTEGSDGYTINLFIPPVDTVSLITIGWIEACFAAFNGQVFLAPQTCTPIPMPLEHYLGQVFFATSDQKPLNFMVDMGYLEAEKVMTYTTFDHRFKSILERQTDILLTENEEPLIMQFTVISECLHYYDIAMFYVADEVGQDMSESLSMASSVFLDD